MPKAERGTPKDIANRAKAKGLQKLKFYCQMCQKQCRDENGLKCHMTSDSHLRQMQIFVANPGAAMDSFSRDFESMYLETLRRRHGTKRMNANNVYQEVIRDKHHVHMNATVWATLSDFVQYLGKSGKCVVEETERGWYVQYVERDPALLARAEAARRRAEAERAEEERMRERRERMVREAAEARDGAGASAGVVGEASRLGDRRGGGSTGPVKPVAIALDAKKTKATSKGVASSASLATKSVFEDNDDENDSVEEGPVKCNADAKIASNGTAAASSSTAEGGTSNVAGTKRRSRWGRSNDDNGTGAAKPTTSYPITAQNGRSGKAESDEKLEPPMKRSKASGLKLKDRRKDYWLQPDIVVKIISKKLAKGRYYKRKGVVTKVVDKYTAEVEVLDDGSGNGGGDVVRLDQDDLETVVPKVGRRVLILNGLGRGRMARLVSLDTKRYCATLEVLAEGDGGVKGSDGADEDDRGAILDRVEYEDFSKVA